MSTIGPTLEAYFANRLVSQRQASPRTISAYRDLWRLLLHFACERSGKTASKLDFGDLDAAVIGAFLTYLEGERGNTVRSRNTRLAAIHSFFRYSALVHPEHAGLIQRVLAIPAKRCDRADISFLSPAEVDALLATPDRSTWIGRRDHALLLVAMQTGLRVSELTGLTRGSVELGAAPPYVRSYGKGRKNRVTPLTSQAVAVLKVWLQERGGVVDDPLFPSRRGDRLSRDAVEFLLTKYVTSAKARCPSLRRKNVTAHVLRHTAAMLLLQAGVDTTGIALWLGHESLKSTQIYLHATGRCPRADRKPSAQPRMRLACAKHLPTSATAMVRQGYTTRVCRLRAAAAGDWWRSCAADGGRAGLAAWEFLRHIEQMAPPPMHEAPLRIVTPAWRRLAVRIDKSIDRRAYHFCLLQTLLAAFNRHDLYVTPSHPRAHC